MKFKSQKFKKHQLNNQCAKLFKILSGIVSLILCVSSLSVKSQVELVDNIALDPVVGSNVFLLEGDKAFDLMANCKLPLSANVQYWRPTVNQIQIIEEKLKAATLQSLVDPEFVTGKRLYFGTLSPEKKRVKILLYQSRQPEIPSDFGQFDLDCIRIKAQVDFDLDQLKFDL